MYFDPYMQKAMLLDDEDPNALLEATGAPVSAPPAPQYPSPTMAGFGPTGPLGASQGIPQVDPALARDARIMGMFSNINQVAGGQGLVNPFQNQIEATQKLQMERMRQLQQSKVDNPFYDYELAKSRGYFKLKEGEDDAQGFRRFTQEQFKDPAKSVYAQRVEGLVASGIDETLANQYVNGAVEARTGPGGITQLVNTLTGEVEQTLTAEQAAAIESTIAESKSFADTTAQRNAEKVATYMTRINEIAVAGVAFDQTMEQIDGWVDRLESGDLQTGLVSGFLTELGLMGTELEGEALADSVEQALYNLQITNLAPVTEKEIQFIKGLFMDLKSPTEVNIGKLKAALKRISRQVEMADYEAQNARDFVLEFGDDTQKGFINKFFPANIGLEEAKKRAQGGGV